MVDGLYQSVIGFFIPYLTFQATFVTSNGLDDLERLRLGTYIAHPSVITINLYILINTYRWDWLTLLCIAISILLIFFWTGLYTSLPYSSTFYGAAVEVYGEASFWAVLFVTPIVSILPRYFVKAIQKVYFPYDVDIVREQVAMGQFDHLPRRELDDDKKAKKPKSSSNSKKSASSSLGSPRRRRHQKTESLDEDLRPIYPPSVTTYNAHSQNGSDGTNYTRHEQSLDMHRHDEVEEHDHLSPPTTTPATKPPTTQRARPSFDRFRASMDQVRPSFEATNEFTSAAMLSRFESSHTGASNNNNNSTEGGGIVERIRRRTRGKSIKSPKIPTGFSNKDGGKDGGKDGDKDGGDGANEQI